MRVHHEPLDVGGSCGPDLPGRPSEVGRVHQYDRRRLGPATGDPTGFSGFDELFEAWQAQLSHFIQIKYEGNLVIERVS